MLGVFSFCLFAPFFKWNSGFAQAAIRGHCPTFYFVDLHFFFYLFFILYLRRQTDEVIVQRQECAHAGTVGKGRVASNVLPRKDAGENILEGFCSILLTFLDLKARYLFWSWWVPMWAWVDRATLWSGSMVPKIDTFTTSPYQSCLSSYTEVTIQI